jgi:4-hydroxybenzoate polyprenyltransferase
MLAVCYLATIILMGAAFATAGAGLIAYLGLAAFAAHLAWQIRRLDIDDPVNCLIVFKSNRDAGLILFAGLVANAAAHAFFS